MAMEKKSSGGGQGSGGGQKDAPKPSTPSLPFESGAAKNPRATLDAIAAVVLPGTDAKGAAAAPQVDPKKHLHTSAFSSGTATTDRRAKLPSVWTGSNANEGGEAPAVEYDGNMPANEVTSRDVWRAIQPPVQSREDRRSPDLYLQVINQFAVGINPRYEPDAPEKPRAHIFVWDVTRAMNAEIPHMVGARELTLVQTVDWLRYEGGQRGWVKVMAPRAVECANEGKPVVVIPKSGVSKVSLLAIVRPGPADASGNPRVAAAAKARGNDLSPQEALGVSAFEFYVHP